MTFSEIKQLVSYNVDDLAFGYFTEAQVGMFCNNALKELWKRLIQAGENFYLKRVCTPMIQDQYEYVLPIDFSATRRVEYYQGTPPNENIFPLASTTLMEISRLNSAPGQPSAYYLKKDRLVLDRPMDVNNTYNLRLYYDYFVGDMTLNSDEPDAPERYHEYIAVLATLECVYKDGRDPSPWLKKKEYYETLLKQDAERRTRDYPRMIVSTQEDAYWAY